MSYKDDEEEIIDGADLGEEDEEAMLSPDDIDDSLLDDDMLIDDDFVDEDEEDMEDFAGLDGSSEY